MNGVGSRFSSSCRWSVVWLAALSLGVSQCFSTYPAAGAGRRSDEPNLVLIVSDDQGYNDLGCLGAKPILTPNLDRLVREGVRASNFCVTWAACTPSRGSILTGRYPQRNGLYDMIRNDSVNYGHRFTEEEYAVSPEMTLGLDVREVLISQVLKQAGYATGVIGKWDSGRARRFLPLQRGFDYFYGFANTGIDYYTHERYGIPSMFRGNDRTQEDRGVYATDLFRREAIRFIRQHGDKPFFLYLAFNAPHAASSFAGDPGRPGAGVGVQAPEEFLRHYPDLKPEAPLTRYFAAVTCMDAAIGEVLETLETLGLATNTLVVFLSDNGGSGNGGNAPLRAGKGSLFEGGLRAPFVARWPGRLPAGRVTDEFLTSLELFPSLLTAAGVKPPADVQLDGFDMLPVLRGEKSSPRTEMFWQRRSHRAARVGQWKWVASGSDSGLFDLAADPGEARDLSTDRPDVLRMVHGRFDRWWREMETAEPRGPFRDY